MAAALDVTPAEAIVIEDSAHGVEAARRAGMASIAVGAIVHRPGLDEVLARVPGRPCLPLGTLDELTWAQVETLWQGGNRYVD